MNYNVFICYRGTGSNNSRNCVDGKYVALDVCYELEKAPFVKCFFAPKVYKAGDDFRNDVPKILSTVKVAILVMTDGFFDYCEDENDILRYEIKCILERPIKILPISVNGFSLQDKRDKLIAIFGEENVNKFITTVNTSYNGIYDFPKATSELCEQIKGYLAAAENNYSFQDVDNKSLLYYLDEICACSSVTYALDKIIEALKNVLQNDKQTLKEIRTDVVRLINKVCERVPHFSTLKNQVLEELISLLKKYKNHDDARDALDKYMSKKADVQKKILKYRTSAIAQNDGILVFSESKHVINILTELINSTKKTCTVYVCEARAKVALPFSDAKRIYDQLHNYKEKYLITENSIYTLMAEGKITKVLLGACAVDIKDGILTSFVNTSGTESILLWAKKLGIPVCVISELDKKLVEFKNRENIISTKDVSAEGYMADEINYVHISREENVIFISEIGIDIAEIVGFYLKDICKDKRILTSSSAEFIKHCDANEFLVEKKLLDDLVNKAEINVAKIIDTHQSKKDNYLNLERIKGMRLFELFVTLDYLGQASCDKAILLKKRLLERCNIQQNVLNHRIKELLSNDSSITPYPAIKIVDFIPFLYKMMLISYSQNVSNVSLTELKTEAKAIYDRFLYFVNQNPMPFRDSTLKNMAINDPRLMNIEFDISTKEKLEGTAQKIYSIISEEDFDYFENAKIYDFDFSSCINTTAFYDDFIGLNMHERSYSIEIENQVINEYIDNEEFLIALIVRFLRFGGRKLAYKIINPDYHKIRFMYDDGQFYFKKIKLYIDVLFPKYKESYPNFYKLVCDIAEADITTPEFDIFSYMNSDFNRTAWQGMCEGNFDESLADSKTIR